jgi:hypothetical protein
MTVRTEETIKGSLHKADYGQKEERTLEQGTYDFTLTVTGEGQLSFRVDSEVLKDHGSSWVNREDKSKIQGDNVVEGHFEAVETSGGTSNVRFHFKREFLSKGVDYTVSYTKR